MCIYITNVIKKNIKQFLGVTKKGFINMYGLLLLSVTFSFLAYVYGHIKSVSYMKKQDADLLYAEIYAIRTIEAELLAYEEENHDIYYKDYTITLSYDDITCEFTIHKDDKIYLKARAVYDDIDEMFVSYTYL